MKFRFVFLTLATAMIMLVACTTYRTNPSGKMPPGQAKKLSGSQSAKPFAPGQQQH